MNFFSVELLAGEKLIKIIRKSFWDFLAFSFRLWIVAGVFVAFYFLYPDFNLKNWLLVGGLFFWFLFLIRDFLVWYLESLVITDQRLIDVFQRSLTDRVVTEVSLRDVKTVAAINGKGVKRWFKIGCLVVSVAEGGKIAVLNMVHPGEIALGINQLKSDLEKKKEQSGA